MITNRNQQPAQWRFLLIGLTGILWLRQESAQADLSLETETARLLEPGHFGVSMAYEYQFARAGHESAVPLALEVGLLPRLELLLEPTTYVGIFPRGGKSAQGLGDMEATLTFLAFREQTNFPAIALAGEVKFPTARNLSIGTRAYDYTPYLIMSKRFGDLDLHANVSYTFLGQPPGANVKDTWTFSFAGEYTLHRKWDVFVEIMYTTSARGSSSKGGGAEGGAGGEGGGARAEIAGVELIGTVGLRHHFNSHLDLFGSASFDNAHATLLRTGLTFKF